MSDKQKKSRQTPADAQALRKRAEAQARKMDTIALGAKTPEEIQQMFHELRVHQIELTMQNEELRTAQARIEAGRAKYFDLYNLAPVSYFTISEKGLILEASLTAATLLGVTRNALVKQPISRFILKEDQDIYHLHRKQLFETNELREFELRLVKPDGAFFWAHLSETVSQAEDGSPICRLVISDITGRRQVENTLKAALYELKESQKVAKVGNWVWHIPQNLVVWSDEMYRIFGIEKDQFTGDLSQIINDCIHPEDRAEVDCSNASVMESNTPIPVEYRIIRPDGSVLSVLAEAGELELDNAGKPLLLRGIVHDITARKNAEDSLRASDNLLSRTQEISHTGSWKLDLTANRLIWSDETYRIFGCEPQEFAVNYEAFLDFVHPDDRAAVAEAYSLSQREGRDGYDIEHRIVRRNSDDVRYVHERCVHERDASGAIIQSIGMVQDITERKRIEIYREMSRKLMQILNEPGKLKEDIQRVLAALKIWTGFDAVGLRLQKGEDFPYFILDGFSPDFLLTENSLLQRDKDGVVCRDKDGNIRLDGTCGLVISGKIDPESPFFTQGGSFWTNDSFSFLDPESHQDPRQHPRNYCIHQGYASMALIPIRTRNRIVGLIQFNDKRKGCFTLETIEMLEDIAAHIGSALMRKQAEEELLEKELQYRNLANSGLALIWTSGTDKLCNYFNERWLHFTGRTLEQEMGNGWVEGVHPDDFDHCFQTYSTAFDKQESFDMEYRLRHASGEYRWLQDLGTPNYNSAGEFVGYIGHCFDITERKRMQLKLRRVSDELLRASRMALVGGWSMDLKSGELVWSEVTRDIHEVGPDFIPDLQSAISFYKEGESRRKITDVVTQCRETGESFDADLQIVTAKGRECWVRAMGTAEFQDGRSVRLFGTFQDITERKRIEEIQLFLAQTSSAKSDEPFFNRLARYLARVLEMDFVCIDRLEGDGLIARTVAVWCDGHFENNVTYSLKDTPCGDVVGRTVCCFPVGVSQLFPSDQTLQELRAESYIGVTLFDSAGQPIGLIAVIGRRPLRDRQLAESTLKLVAPRAAGEMELMDAQESLQKAHDNLERLVAERTEALSLANLALRKEEERFRTVADFTYDWGYWVSPEDEIIYMSPSCERITGYTSAEFQARPELLVEIVHPEDLPKYIKHYLDYTKNITIAAAETDYRIVQKSGEIRWIAQQSQAVIGSDGACLGRRISNRDETERKQAIKVQEDLKAQLQQNEKMAVVGQLAGGMAHDLNNRLAVILGCTDMMQMKAHLSAAQKQYCAAISESASRGAELISQLMAFSRKGPYVRTAVDIRDLVRRVHEFLLRSFDQNIRFSVHVPESPIVIMGDVTLIQNALMNLAINARDAMPDGGEIFISVERVKLDLAFCNLRSKLEPGEYICLKVKDTGIGMTTEVRDHIFEPFFTTKPEGKGTGLGLASVFGTVKSHCGHIDLDTAHGKGATFEIYLPMAVSSAQAPPVFVEDEMVSGQGRILVADDESILRTLFFNILPSLGYEVTVAVDGQEAIAHYRENYAWIDLVILDINMPNMSGMNLFQEILRIRPDAKVLFASGYTEPEEIKKALENGLCGFLKKPFSIARLSQAVASALENTC